VFAKKIKIISNLMGMKNFLFVTLTLVCLFAACRKQEDYITDSSAKLAFSQDTLRFDTVFTQIGSATRFLKVKNPNDRPIRISKIALSNQADATFNLNVDGIAGRTFQNVEIAANDSIYVFAEVTVNPNAPLSISPFVITNDVVFETNGNIQKIVLEAWGQNANYIPSRFGKGTFNELDCQGSTVVWDDKKPYVIYGVLFVSNGVLHITAGTRVHVHGGFSKHPRIGLYNDGRIYVLSSARLQVEGTLAKPVIFQGDRLEKEFKEDAGQWTGIILDKGSINNQVNNAIIKNSKLGIYVDSTASLNLQYSQIFNTEGAALIGFRGNINAKNCLFHSNGGGTLNTLFGGNYDFNYCTMANLGTTNPALNLGNSYCAAADSNGNCTRRVVGLLNANFTNCLIYGNKEDEIAFANPTKPNNFNFSFKNCIVRVKDLTKTENTPDFFSKCTDCINAPSGSKVFKKPTEANYHLDSLSIAFKKAKPIPSILDDLDGKRRDVNTPDIGCYDFPNR
jgi:hypothetical protein